MLRALSMVVDPSELTAIVNVGDDLVLHGLHISPDIDTVVYTLADAIDPERGWGLVDESWRAMETLGRYGGATWFGLGDRDLGTHLYRTQRLDDGAPLSAITSEIASAWGLDLTVLPVTDDRLRTIVTLAEGGDVSFQEYFVERRHAVAVSAVAFEGADAATPATGVLDSISAATTVVLAPSNPLVSIAPVLAVRGVRDAIRARRDDVVAVSPIVAGAALKGPADRMLVELGHDASVVGVARLYLDLAATLVIDTADADLAPQVEALGMRCIVTDTVMRTPEVSRSLATVVLGGDPS